ncbi:MAG: RNA polymerase sigma factor [Pseudomonadota bacterium]|uniref:RNA polymerase sigma factor n=1 Tax=Roseovarius TaxID=74030 RepID=UPI0022A8CE2D|nr:RNA polymerase sigma factor [Roseovarius sp. EGI FJ00037]MCZ0812647.1 RNA polymerase sigma factor [Roseovarius sp. EGI FJ00037]
MTDTPDPKKELIEHLPAMRAFAMSLTRNPATADDLVQDTIVKAWGNFDRFKPGTNLRAWLFTILRNTYYSLYRKRRREVEDPEGQMAGAISEKPAHDGHLVMTDFREAFAQLSDEQREVLILVGAEGFSYEDAAEMCGCAVGTVKSRTNRARKRLAELMHLDEDEGLEMTDAATLAVVQGNPAA